MFLKKERKKCSAQIAAACNLLKRCHVLSNINTAVFFFMQENNTQLRRHFFLAKAVSLIKAKQLQKQIMSNFP